MIRGAIWDVSLSYDLLWSCTNRPTRRVNSAFLLTTNSWVHLCNVLFLIYSISTYHMASLFDGFGAFFRSVNPKVHCLPFCTSMLGVWRWVPTSLLSLVLCWRILNSQHFEIWTDAFNHFSHFVGVACFLVEFWYHYFEVPAHHATNTFFNYDFSTGIVQN